MRAGKIMGYDAVTGHRIKEPFNQVNWVHSVRKVPDFHMQQCLFGEHLLSDTSAAMSAKPVAIVESEKTAYEMRESDWSSDVCSSDLSRKVVDTECRRFETNGISNHVLHGYGMESQAIQRL